MIEFNRNIVKIVDTIVRRERKCNQEVSDNCRDEILETIYNNVKKDRAKSLRRKLYVANSIAAAVIIGIISLITYDSNRVDTQSYENIIASTSVGSQNMIVIFNDDFNIEIPTNATIVNTINGDLIVNGMKVNIKSNSKYRQVAVPKDEVAKITLSDGSKVVVNSNSRLIYKTGTDNQKRDAYIIGEAFFNISKDDKRPFTVNAKNFAVNVTGTKFIVKSNNLQAGCVALISGSVNVSLYGGTKNVSMSPNDILVLDGKQVNVRVVDNISSYTSWVDRLIEFDRDNLSYVAEYISNFYNIDVIIPDKYKSTKITGKLDLKEDVNKVLNVVSILAGLEVEQTNNNIYTFKK